MTYTVTTWANDGVPAISAANLQKIEDELERTAASEYISTGGGTVDETTDINNFLTANTFITIPYATYLGQTVIPDNKIVFMRGNPTFKLQNSVGVTNKAALKIGANVRIIGTFTVDGNVTNNAGGSASAVTGTLQFTGSNTDVSGSIFINNAYEAGLAVWNGSTLTTGTAPENINISGMVTVTNCAGHTGYIWQVDGFKAAGFRHITGAESGDVSDRRLRVGTQAGTTYADNVDVGRVYDCSVITETNCRVFALAFNNDSGTKIENTGDTYIGEIHLDGKSASTGNMFSIGGGSATPISENVFIDKLTVKNCTVSGGITRHIAIASSAFYPKNIIINTLICIDNAGGSDIGLRDVTNVRINTAFLLNDGSGSRGLLVESAYDQQNLTIGHMVSSGHSTSDVEDADGVCVIESLNSDAVRVGHINGLFNKSFPKSTSISVGSGGTFTTLKAALEYATEYYRPTFYPTDMTTARLTITLLTGYIWNEAIEIDGQNLGWITITSDTAVRIVCTNVICMKATGGAVAPKIAGDYDKNNTSGDFLQCLYNSCGELESLDLIGLAAFPANAQLGGKITMLSANCVKHASATASDCAAYALTGGEIVARSATVPYATVDQGGKIYLSGGTATGGESVTVNTLAATGYILQ